MLPFEGLLHLADLARRNYIGAHIWRFWFISTSTAAQRYHIVKNGSTSLKTVVHGQDMARTSAKKLATVGDGITFFNILINVCRCAAGASNATTTAVLRYGFVNVGRAPVAPRNRSSALRWLQCVPAFMYHIGSSSAVQRRRLGITSAAPR